MKKNFFVGTSPYKFRSITPSGPRNDFFWKRPPRIEVNEGYLMRYLLVSNFSMKSVNFPLIRNYLVSKINVTSQEHDCYTMESVDLF